MKSEGYVYLVKIQIGELSVSICKTRHVRQPYFSKDMFTHNDNSPNKDVEVINKLDIGNLLVLVSDIIKSIIIKKLCLIFDRQLIVTSQKEPEQEVFIT